MAIDSALFTSVDPSPAPTFSIAALDMTGVGWSLRTACQIAVEDRPDGYCRLPVGHGGAHEARPAKHRVAPPAGARGSSTGSDGDVDEPDAIARAWDETSALAWQRPGRLLRPRGKARPGPGQP